MVLPCEVSEMLRSWKNSMPFSGVEVGALRLMVPPPLMVIGL